MLCMYRNRLRRPRVCCGLIWNRARRINNRHPTTTSQPAHPPTNQQATPTNQPPTTTNNHHDQHHHHRHQHHHQHQHQHQQQLLPAAFPVELLATAPSVSCALVHGLVSVENPTRSLNSASEKRGLALGQKARAGFGSLFLPCFTLSCPFSLDLLVAFRPASFVSLVLSLGIQSARIQSPCVQSSCIQPACIQSARIQSTCVQSFRVSCPSIQSPCIQSFVCRWHPTS